MQINVHIPRSAIRYSLKDYGRTYDVFDVAVTNAIGAWSFVGYEHVGVPDVSMTLKVPRRAMRAIKKYDSRRLDSPVRFRLTIPDAK